MVCVNTSTSLVEEREVKAIDLEIDQLKQPEIFVSLWEGAWYTVGEERLWSHVIWTWISAVLLTSRLILETFSFGPHVLICKLKIKCLIYRIKWHNAWKCLVHVWCPINKLQLCDWLSWLIVSWWGKGSTEPSSIFASIHRKGLCYSQSCSKYLILLQSSFLTVVSQPRFTPRMEQLLL